jgi:hypothetical protein
MRGGLEGSRFFADIIVSLLALSSNLFHAISAISRLSLDQPLSFCLPYCLHF